MVVFVVALVVMATASWVPSYWNDEAATLRLARLSPTEMLAFVQHKDAVHAIYAALMHGWIGLVGESEFAVRLPSAAAIAAAAAGLYVLLRGLNRSRAALLASIVFVLLPRSTFNGVEARSSALVTALVVWSALAAIHAARSGRWWRWAALAGMVGAAVAVFLYAVLVLPALVLLAAASRPTATVAFKTLLASIVGVILAAPIWATALGQSAQVGWLVSQPVNIYTVVVEPFFGASWWLVAVVILVLALGAFRPARTETRRLVLATISWIVVPLAILLAGSALISPMFTPRYLSMSSPAIAILVALALAPLRARTVVALMTVIAVAALPAYITARTPLGKPAGQDLRGLANLLEEQGQPGDAIILGDEGTVSLRPRIAIAAYPDAFTRLDDIAFASSYATTGTYSDQLLESEALNRQLEGEDRVWIVDPAAGPPAVPDKELVNAGLRPQDEERLSTMTITLWIRDQQP